MKRSVNIIDVLVIIVIAIIIAAGAAILSKPTTEPTYSSTVILEVKEKTSDFCKIPKEGDTLVDYGTKVEIGKILSIETKKSSSDLTSIEDNKIVKSEMPDRYDLMLTLELHSLENEPKIGTALSVQGKTYVCAGHVVEIIDSGEVAK